MSPLILPLSELLRLTPDALNAKIFARLCNHFLRGQDLVSRLDEIDNKSITISITDVPCVFHFRVLNGRLKASRFESGDVTISGSLKGFLQLACRQQDPDTLFFQRILNIEGETETGVYIKNILDSLEYDLEAHIDDVLPPPFAQRIKHAMNLVQQYTPERLRRHLTNLGPW